MNTKQTAVAQGVAKAVGTSAKRAGKAKVFAPLGMEARLGRAESLFVAVKDAESKFEEAKAYRDSVRFALRDELVDGQKEFATPKLWGAYCKGLRELLVKTGISTTPKKARELLDNQLIALGLTGKTERAGAGGARPGSGRKEKAEGKAKSDNPDAIKNRAAREFIRAAMSTETRPDVLETLGELAFILK